MAHQHELRNAQIEVAPRCSDEDFLRRAYFDITGAPPSSSDVTLFGLDPHPGKRSEVVDQLLTTHRYARNWGSIALDLFIR